VLGLKDAIEKKAGKQFKVFKPLSYATQVVNGTNYFVKIDVGNEAIHVRIYKPIRNPPEVVAVKAHQSLTSEITYF